MNRNIFISKKMYVAPLISFEEVEEKQDLLAGSKTVGDVPGMPGTDDPYGYYAKKSGAFDESNDFVFEIDVNE